MDDMMIHWPWGFQGRQHSTAGLGVVRAQVHIISTMGFQRHPAWALRDFRLDMNDVLLA